HWCHVMAQESFEDQATADYLNAHFVAVKVDREERPDVDAAYMAATQALSGEGGWPMSVFLLPDGRAFHAGTYYPPRPLPGRPAFRQVLAAVHEAWQERRDAVEKNAAALARGLADVQAAAAVRLDRPAPEPEAALLADAVLALARAEDAAGGFGTAPKFPPSAVLEFLVRHAAVPSGTAEAARDLAGRAFAAMARSALFDQLDGGFARYSVTRDWSVPHFEKMLYDNAQLLRGYAHWVRLGGSEAYPAAEATAVAGATADWMLDALGLRGADGGIAALASSLDADTVVDGMHSEGGSYLWTAGDLAAVLGPEDGAAVAGLMHVAAAGSPLHPGGALSGAEAELWRRVRPALRTARAARPQPARDGKVVAGWNGLAVAALADAGAVLDRPELLAAAERIAGYLERVHWTPGRDGQPGLLVRVSHDGRARGIGGLLEDYAFCIDGLLALYAATGRSRWYGFAEALLSAACARFADGDSLRDSAGESAQVMNAQGRSAGADPFDDATPSGAAAFAGVLLGYAALSGSAGHRALAGSILTLLPPLARQAPRAAGGLLAAAQAALAGPVEAAVAGAPTPLRAALHRELLRSPSPGLVIALQEPPSADPGGSGGSASVSVPLLRGREADTAPLAYLCRGMVCRQPARSIAELREQLATMAE
ncbi:MAG TPA: DUF255 domain-containing protein, partial [Arthrobacter sp.]|nr:DUF255 domain-containing protein [Arthrobacter sp.]